MCADGVARCDACDYVVALSRSTDVERARPDASHGVLPFPLGSVLRERYCLRSLIGRGSHGVTYLAHHQFLNHPCVLKALPHRIADASDAAVQRLRLEASAGYRVNHANVVRVLDGDVVDGVWFFVMEYVDGVDLASVLRATDAIDWRQVTDIALDVAAGLDAIHQVGLTHRDIKPSNLLLRADGRTSIADLGVAGLLPHADPNGGDGDGQVGTPAYAAPEVFANGAVGPAADLYSLGATLYELLNGAPPHGGSVYRNLLRQTPDELAWSEETVRATPDWFRQAIERLLAPDPGARFASPQALADYLDNPTKPRSSPPPSRGTTHPAPGGVVVLPLQNASGVETDDWIGQAVSDQVARSLAQMDGAYVVDVNQFMQTLERVRVRGGISPNTALLQAGRLSGAASVVEGRFTRAGELIEIVVTIHDAAGGTEHQQTVTGALSSLADLEADLLSGLAEHLRLAVPAAGVPGAEGTHRAPAAIERFFTGKQAFLCGDYERAMRLGQEALEIDESFSEAVGFVGVCCARMGDYDEAVAYNRRQYELAAQADDGRIRVEAHANLGSMYYFQGDYESANEWLGRAADAAEKLGLTAELALIRNNLGFALLQLGRPTEAEASYRKAIETHKRHGALVSLIGPYNGLGHVLREQHRYEEARDYFHRALALAQESDDRVNAGVAYMNLGQCALKQGRLGDAKHELAVALNVLEHTKFWNGLARVYEYMAELNLTLGNGVEAARCAERRLELAQRHANAPMADAARKQKDRALRLHARHAAATELQEQ